VIEMSKDKKPFLTVDYAKGYLTEEQLKKQEECPHVVLIPVDKQILMGNYRKVNLIEYHCQECGRVFIKETKNKK
jgi:hypothetical protein